MYAFVEGMAMFQRIGNGIDASIKLETDVPSKHRDGKMPLLDVKVWIEEREEKSERRDIESIEDKSDIMLYHV